jgi:hypothetical protein
MRVAVLVLALCAALANPALGFYLPGVAPQDYARVRGAPRPSAPDQHFHFHGSPTFSRFSSHAFDPIRAPPLIPR